MFAHLLLCILAKRTLCLDSVLFELSSIVFPCCVGILRFLFLFSILGFKCFRSEVIFCSSIVENPALFLHCDSIFSWLAVSNIVSCFTWNCVLTSHVCRLSTNKPFRPCYGDFPRYISTFAFFPFMKRCTLL